MNKILTEEKNLVKSIKAANSFLNKNSEKLLLNNVGRIIKNIPSPPKTTKKWFQKSYVLGPEQNDFLAGKGVFYITEGRKLFLDA
ncbi:MAG TPA: hypothetical protein PLP13_05215, partial [bacterium]|nr:hypothetical protein [bacterium]